MVVDSPAVAAAVVAEAAGNEGVRHAGDHFFFGATLAHSALGKLPHSCLSGPAGFPRENLSLIGTGLTGLLALGALNFHP